ncbi:TIGR02391 family protein [Jatrophihabitans sp. DSM 45814]
MDEDLRLATRSRFVSKHFADAVESAVKALCECIRARTGRTDDGDELMTNVFSLKNPLLRLNALKSKTDDSEQRGHMMLCQGVVAAWRNPRAHALLNDEPQRALLMVEMIQDLMRGTKAATKTRKKKSP